MIKQLRSESTVITMNTNGRKHLSLFSRFRTGKVTARFSGNAGRFAIEGMIYALILTFAHNNNNLYASRLGASATELSLISSLPPIVGLFALIPFAILTDRLRNKKPVVMISILSLGFIYVLCGTIAFLPESRVGVLIALLVIANIPMSLYNSSWQAFFSDVVTPGDRNSVYSFRTQMGTSVSIVVPLIAGVILTIASGTGKIMIHQVYYILAFPLAFLQVYFLRGIQGGYMNEATRIGWKDVRLSARSLLRNRHFLGFLAVALLVYCGWEMDWSLYFLAQFRYLHLNETGMSLIAVFCAVTQFAAIPLWTRIAKRRGVRFLFVLGALGFALCSLTLIISLLLPPVLGILVYFVFLSIGSATYSAFQISLIQCLLEAIPEKNRTLSIAVFNSIILISNIVMPFLGVAMYRGLGENKSAMILTLCVVASLRFIATLAAAFRWYKMKALPDVARIGESD